MKNSVFFILKNNDDLMTESPFVTVSIRQLATHEGIVIIHMYLMPKTENSVISGIFAFQWFRTPMVEKHGNQNQQLEQTTRRNINQASHIIGCENRIRTHAHAKATDVSCIM
jgi:hypothetical protein